MEPPPEEFIPTYFGGDLSVYSSDTQDRDTGEGSHNESGSAPTTPQLHAAPEPDKGRSAKDTESGAHLSPVIGLSDARPTRVESAEGMGGTAGGLPESQTQQRTSGLSSSYLGKEGELLPPLSENTPASSPDFRSKAMKPRTRQYATSPRYSNPKKQQAHTRDSSFRVVSYNVLADGPHYALSYKHQYCSIRDRLWEARYPRILDEIDGYDGDILCFQETTATTFRRNFAVDLQASGYRAIHAIRNRQAGHHTTAVFVRNETLSVVHLVMLKYAEMAHDLLREEKSVPIRNLLKLLTELDDVAIICHLRHRSSESPVVVATTHLHYNPVNPHLKAMQANLLLDALSSHLQKWNLDPTGTQVVLAGDLNSLPKKTVPDEFDPVLPEGGLVSGVYELITEGSLPETHLDHPSTREPSICKGVPALSSSLRLRSAMLVALGAEPLLTTKTADFCGTLDYVFVNNPGAVLRVLDMPVKTQQEARDFPPIPDGGGVAVGSHSACSRLGGGAPLPSS